MQPSPLFLSKWYSPFPPTSASLPPQPCAPRPVSGGDQLCQPRQATHTHAHTQTKLLALPMKPSCFSAALGLSFQSRWGEGIAPLLSPPLIRTAGFWRGEEPVLGGRGFFPSSLPPWSWDAGGVQREQQVGKNKSWDCFHGNQEFVYCWWAWPWWYIWTL